MWLVEPMFMCRKHLLGEHLEMHMFLGSLKKKKKLDGFFKNNLFEPRILFQRHQDLSEEMIRRGYNHNSPMTEKDCFAISHLPEHYQNWKIEREKALDDLIGRCEECRKNINKYLQTETNNSIFR